MSIQILPARLANQIAAGEVVERPASVVKELVENSLDAGATRIDVEIERGGAKCIRIKDNGKGVDKEQLTLALSRHATSKISHLDDLEAIVSLGFRGEALASVSSVSRLTFTSKPADQEQAWQAVAEGRDMQVNVQPAAHPQGTTVEVLDLFFNTPARRRFLKTEKTEFQHIDELIKRIALSRFDIALSLKHNNKVIRQYRAAPEQAQQEKRIAAICSEQFIQHAVFFEHADQALKISGWISDRLSPRPIADVQYCYINGRMIRDKLVNHAIKQVTSHFLPQGMFPGYIIYIECDAKEVDVNVHPAKHEVRFHQARWVHDFISSTLNTTLSDSSLLTHQVDVTELNASNERVSEHAYQPPQHQHQVDTTELNASNDLISEHAPQHQRQTGSYAPASSSNAQGSYSGQAQKAFQRPELSEQQVNAYCDFVTQAYQQPVSIHVNKVESNNTKSANVINLIDNKFALIQPINTSLLQLSENGLLLLSLKQASSVLISQYLLNAWQDGEVIAQPLLLPVRFKADSLVLDVAERSRQVLSRLGFSYKSQSHFLIISQVPTHFRHAPIAAILPVLFNYLGDTVVTEKTQDITLLCEKLSELLVSYDTDKIFSMSEVEDLIGSLIELPIAALQDCCIQPDLSLLIKGIN